MSCLPVLIMEDEIHLLRLFSMALQRSGYQVYEASTISIARQLILNMSFAVFIADMRMGNERGIDLLNEQFERLQANLTKILVVSAESAYEKPCQELGVEMFLTKPVTPFGVIQILHSMFSPTMAGTLPLQ
jgi:DNA-binding NtrC family response regulator